MRKLPLTLIVTTCLAAGGALIPSVARAADDKAMCVSSYEKTQTLRKQNKLREAREQLLVCTRDVCPKLVRVDCARWMEEVTSTLPSLVFAVRDAQGRDRTDVRVLIDGEVVKEQLGQEVIVDPGPHAIRFEASNAEPIEEQVVVRAGEKSRAVTITLSGPLKPTTTTPHTPTPTPTPTTPDQPPPATDDGGARPLPILIPVLGAAGVTTLGVGVYLAISGASQLDDLRSTCAPHCDQSDVDALNLRYRIGGIAIGAGAIAIGVAVWMFVTRPRATHDRIGRSVLVPVGISPTAAVFRF